MDVLLWVLVRKLNAIQLNPDFEGLSDALVTTVTINLPTVARKPVHYTAMLQTKFPGMFTIMCLVG